MFQKERSLEERRTSPDETEGRSGSDGEFDDEEASESNTVMSSCSFARSLVSQSKASCRTS